MGYGIWDKVQIKSQDSGEIVSAIVFFKTIDTMKISYVINQKENRSYPLWGRAMLLAHTTVYLICLAVFIIVMRKLIKDGLENDFLMGPFLLGGLGGAT